MESMASVLYVRLPVVRRVRRGVGDINALAAGIQTMEGYIPPNSKYPQGSLAFQNNNPGNIMYIGQPGAVLGAGGFAKWPSYDAGYQGLLNQINGNAASGMTLRQFVCHYAGCDLDCTKCPPGANDTTVYVDQLKKATGASDDTLLTDIIAGGQMVAGGGTGQALQGQIDSFFPLSDSSDDGSFFDSASPLSYLVPIGILGLLWAIR